MAFLVCTSKVWDNDLVTRLEKRLNTKIYNICSPEELTLENLKKISPEKIFFPHWSYIIKPEIFNNYECVIFHMTDLPYGRGGSPLQNLIVRGHKNTMISALKCSDGVDTGPVYMKKPLSIEGRAQDIYKRATDTIESIIIHIVETKAVPKEQTGEVVEFKRRKKADGNVGDLKELADVYDYIRMLDAEGYPPAFLEQGNFLYEFTFAELKDGAVEAKVRITKK